MKQLTLCAALTSLSLVLGGCIVSESDSSDPDAASGGQGGQANEGGQGGEDPTGGSGGSAEGGAAPAEMGWVFTMSNDAEGNELVVFERGDDGSLTALVLEL